MNRDELLSYALDTYGAEPEYLWRDYPDACVLRHQNNRKWFAVIMSVERRKLGLQAEGYADLLDVKCGPLLGGSFLGTAGVVPAWHMNKSQWIGVLLDGTATDDIVRHLLDISWDLTRKKK
jgi:predicted DNA-binding protein (MmcQ/YjbR family)